MGPKKTRRVDFFHRDTSNLADRLGAGRPTASQRFGWRKTVVRADAPKGAANPAN